MSDWGFTVEEAIIGVLGAGILGMLGLFLSYIKSDIRTLGTRLGRVEELLIKVVERLAKIETVQEEHGRLLLEHGRRLTTIESTLEEHGRRLTTIEATLEGHGRLLAQMADHGERIAALEDAAGDG